MATKRIIELYISAKDRASKVLKSITGGLTKLGKFGLIGLGGVTAGVTALGAGLSVLYGKLADQIDQQAKQAAALGITNEKLGVYRDAAGYAGISTNDLNTALRKMSQGVADAANGTGEARDALEELGLDAEKLRAAGPEKAFEEIIAKLSEIPNGIKKTGLAMDIFGRSGSAMANLTISGLRQAQKDADELGLKLSSAQAGGVESANDAWARIKNAGNDFLQFVAARLAPGLKVAFDNAFESLRGVNWTNVGNSIAKGVGAGLLIILEGVEKVAIGIINWQLGLNFVRGLFLDLQLKVWELLAAMRELNIATREMTGIGSDEALADGKRILAEQKAIIAAIKNDMADIDKTQVGLFVEKDKAETALSGFRSKVEEVAKAIEQGATATQSAESKKAAAINNTTSAIEKQILAQQRLNALTNKSGGTFNTYSSGSADAIAKTLDDEADR